MKRFISIVSAFAMLSAVPMSASAESDGQNGNIYNDIENALVDFERHDYNADGKVDYLDVDMVMGLYADMCISDAICINADKTYELNEPDEVCVTEEELIRIIENANLTNPEWIVPSDETKRFDGIDALDASVLLISMREFYTPGDANLDGTIDALDASNVLYAYSISQARIYDGENYTFSQKFHEASLCGDINGDGEVNALDASDILAGYAAAQTA